MEFGFSFLFGQIGLFVFIWKQCVFRLSFNSDIVGTGSLLVNDNLYLLDTVASYGESYCMVLSIELIIQIQEHYGISA